MTVSVCVGRCGARKCAWVWVCVFLCVCAHARTHVDYQLYLDTDKSLPNLPRGPLTWPPSLAPYRKDLFRTSEKTHLGQEVSHLCPTGPLTGWTILNVKHAGTKSWQVCSFPHRATFHNPVVLCPEAFAVLQRSPVWASWSIKGNLSPEKASALSKFT